MNAKSTGTDGQGVTVELDPVLHAPARLRIVSSLAALQDGDTLSFTRLGSLLELTAGNLLTHLRKLEAAGYVRTQTSTGVDGKTTAVELTRAGRIAYDRYREALLTLLG